MLRNTRLSGNLLMAPLLSAICDSLCGKNRIYHISVCAESRISEGFLVCFSAYEQKKRGEVFFTVVVCCHLISRCIA